MPATISYLDDPFRSQHANLERIDIRENKNLPLAVRLVALYPDATTSISMDRMLFLYSFHRIKGIDLLLMVPRSASSNVYRFAARPLSTQQNLNRSMEERPRRALFSCPGADHRKIAKAQTLGADAIVLDLEDTSCMRQAYIYSHSDKICDATKIEEMADERKKRGVHVMTKHFEDSKHVQHLRHHEAEYLEFIATILKDMEDRNEQ